jgi:hypothetical protein
MKNSFETDGPYSIAATEKAPHMRRWTSSTYRAQLQGGLALTFKSYSTR